MTPYQAYYKARYQGRSPELEDSVLADPRYIYLYAKYVIKGKLPEKMHNMMLLHGIEDPNDIDVKEYFEYVSK